MKSPLSLTSLVKKIKFTKILCVGDVILDHFQSGDVDRISPEAPIPVLKLKNKQTMLGGAGNVVRNLAGLGSNVSFVTVVGKDKDGEKIQELLKKEGIKNLTLINDKERQTSIKTRYMVDGQQILRTDHEDLFTLNKSIEDKLIVAAIRAMEDCDCVILSDYAKGVLTDRTIKKLIKAANTNAKTIVVDPKGINYNRYRGADIITPNRRELFESTRMATNSDKEVAQAAKSLIKMHGFGAVLATRSRDGMTLINKNSVVSHLKAEAVDVFDVSGAGDTVVATLAAALGAGASLDQAASLANVAAGIVVGKVGTAVAFTNDLLTTLDNADVINLDSKVVTVETACERVKKWRRSGFSIGFTNGCFDLIHPGHISLLSQAQKSSDKLIVGLNSDSSVKLLKGKQRPIQNEKARATILAALSDVDMVIIFSEKTPIKLIKQLRPDVLIKGADYSVDKIVGLNFIKSYGGQIFLAKLERGHSTTKAIKKIRNIPP